MFWKYESQNNDRDSEKECNSSNNGDNDNHNENNSNLYNRDFYIVITANEDTNIYKAITTTAKIMLLETTKTMTIIMIMTVIMRVIVMIKYRK